MQRHPSPAGRQSLRAAITLVESTQQLRCVGQTVCGDSCDLTGLLAAGLGLKGYSVCWESLCSCLWRYMLIMDWMQWSLVSPPAGSTWPSMPQDVHETLALTTALGYNLLACETCVINCCFDPVSSSTPTGFKGCDVAAMAASYISSNRPCWSVTIICWGHRHLPC